MELGETKSCENEAFIGQSPAIFFSLGVIEIVFNIFISVLYIRRKYFEKHFDETNYVIFILPVYISTVSIVIFIGLFVGIDNCIGIYEQKFLVSIVKLMILRSLSEGVSIFLMHSGIGFRSFRNSTIIGCLWAGSYSIILAISFFLSKDIVFPVMTLFFMSSLVVYYGILYLVPAKCIHRRPAMKFYSAASALLLLAQLISVAIYFAQPDNNAICSVDILFSICAFFQLAIILKVFYDDSMFWQGLYEDVSSNLNQPLLGIWSMNQSTVKIVADSISHLERKVITIIPFSKLKVDTSKFFSGGSARVYKGTYMDNEVAIKFLFCMELSPERVIDFCNEATLLNSLQHPNIVTCCGVAIMPPAISLVTEFCTFGSLFDFLHSTDLVMNNQNSADTSQASQNNVLMNSYSIHTNSINNIYFEGRSSSASSQSRPSTSLRLSNSFHPVGVLTESSQSVPLEGRVANDEKKNDSDHNTNRKSLIFDQNSQKHSTNVVNNTDSHGQLQSPEDSQWKVYQGNDKINTTQLGENSETFSPLQAEDHSHRISYPVSISTAVQSNRASFQVDSILKKDDILAGYLASGNKNNTDVEKNLIETELSEVAAKLAAAMDRSSLVRLNRTHSRTVTSTSMREKKGMSSVSWKAVRSDAEDNHMDSRKSSTILMKSLSAKLQSGKFQSVNRSETKKKRLKSATSLLLSREMNFGLGPGQEGVLNGSEVKDGDNIRDGSRSVNLNRSNHSRSLRQSFFVSGYASTAHSIGNLLPIKARLKLIRDCCSGLAFLHSKGFIHCDIKSLNFLVTSNLIVKLADLGEARRVENISDVRLLPRNNNWSSPEVLENMENCVFQSADIWSLAMVIAEILSGEVPFDVMEFRNMQIEEFIKKLRDGVRPIVPKHCQRYPWLLEMLQQAWQFDFQIRCSASEMLNTMESNVTTAPIIVNNNIPC